MPPVAQQLTADFHVITRTLVALLNGDHGRAREPGLRDHLHHILMATEDAYPRVMNNIAATLAWEPSSGPNDTERVVPWTRDVRRGTFSSALDSCDHLLGERENPAAPIHRRALPSERHQAVIADLRPYLVRSRQAADRLRDHRRAYFERSPHTAPPSHWQLAVGRLLKDVVIWSPMLNDMTLAVENWNFGLLARSLAHLDAGTPFIGLATGPVDVLQFDLTRWHEDVNPARVAALVASDGAANPLEHHLWELTLLTAVAAAHMGGAKLTYTREHTFRLQLPEV